MHSAYLSSVIFLTIVGFVLSTPSNTSSVSTGNVTFTEVLLNSQYPNLESLSQLEGLTVNIHKRLLATLFTGVALKDGKGRKHFSNLVYNMLSEDWTDGDKSNYDLKKSIVPEFHLPIRAVIAVPYDEGYWDVFWSDYGGDHAEDKLSSNSNYRNIRYFYINYTPCAKRCTHNLIDDFQGGGCPNIYAIWPYKISPKGVEKKQMTAISNLISNGCEINTWWDFTNYVDTICALRGDDPLCRDVKTALSTNAFRNRNACAYNLFDIIKSTMSSTDKYAALNKEINKYKKHSYPSIY